MGKQMKTLAKYVFAVEAAFLVIFFGYFFYIIHGHEKITLETHGLLAIFEMTFLLTVMVGLALFSITALCFAAAILVRRLRRHGGVSPVAINQTDGPARGA